MATLQRWVDCLGPQRDRNSGRAGGAVEELGHWKLIKNKKLLPIMLVFVQHQC